MTIDEETGAHWRPALRGANVMWTTADEVSEPPLDGAPPREDWAFRVLDPRSPDAIARLTPFWAEVWKRGDLHWFARAGQYDCTPDHKPYVGATPVPGLFVSCGSSGHGIMTSAGLGRRVADSIAGRLEHADNPFRVDRPFDERSRDLL
jgi:glycine/D-amino acid oxidase-like deaminating enzyme